MAKNAKSIDLQYVNGGMKLTATGSTTLSKGDWITVNIGQHQRFPGTAYISEIGIFENVTKNGIDQHGKPLGTYKSTTPAKIGTAYTIAPQSVRITDIEADDETHKYWWSVTVDDGSGHHWTHDPELVNRKR